MWTTPPSLLGVVEAGVGLVVGEVLGVEALVGAEQVLDLALVELLPLLLGPSRACRPCRASWSEPHHLSPFFEKEKAPFLLVTSTWIDVRVLELEDRVSRQFFTSRV